MSSSSHSLQSNSKLLSQSLIREYLASQGQRNLLDVFDRENPIIEGESITKRSEIYKTLQLSKAENGRESILEKLVLERLKRVKRKEDMKGSKDGKDSKELKEKKERRKCKQFF
mgnify:CR=1 FL=1